VSHNGLNVRRCINSAAPWGDHQLSPVQIASMALTPVDTYAGPARAQALVTNLQHQQPLRGNSQVTTSHTALDRDLSQPSDFPIARVYRPSVRQANDLSASSIRATRARVGGDRKSRL